MGVFDDYFKRLKAEGEEADRLAGEAALKATSDAAEAEKRLMSAIDSVFGPVCDKASRQLKALGVTVNYPDPQLKMKGPTDAQGARAFSLTLDGRVSSVFAFYVRDDGCIEALRSEPFGAKQPTGEQIFVVAGTDFNEAKMESCIKAAIADLV